MSRLPVFENAVWDCPTIVANCSISLSSLGLVVTAGVKRFPVDLHSGTVRHMTATHMFDIRVADLQRFALIVWYTIFRKQRHLRGAIQDPLPYWQH